MRKHKLLYEFWMLRFRLVFFETGVYMTLWCEYPIFRGLLWRRLEYLRTVEDRYLGRVEKELNAMRDVLIRKLS